MDTQIQHLKQKSNSLRVRLSPILYHATLDLRKNLWQTLIQPLSEFIAPIYLYKKAKTRREKIQSALRYTFKSFTSLKKTVKTELIEDLIGYNLNERSNELHQTSFERWNYRKAGMRFTSGLKEEELSNLCKNQPKSMIKYINMQTCLCPVCKDQNIVARCSKEHLESTHNYTIASVHEIALKVLDLTKKQKNKQTRKNKTTLMLRENIVEYADKLIQPNLEKLKCFLDIKCQC